MWDAISSGLGRALGSLLLAGIVYGAYRIGRDTGKERGLRNSLPAAIGVCLFLAVMAAGSLGNATCEDSEPLYGACEERAEDGYTPTNTQRGAQFFYVLILLFVPTVLGLSEGDKRR